MPSAARLNDTIYGSDGGEHMSHRPPHSPGPLTGFISGNVSNNVFINDLPAAYATSITTEYDGCCGTDFGIVAVGSSSVFINGKPAARIGDDLAPHHGNGKVTSGSSNVFIGG